MDYVKFIGAYYMFSTFCLIISKFKVNISSGEYYYNNRMAVELYCCLG